MDTDTWGGGVPGVGEARGRSMGGKKGDIYTICNKQ